MSTLHDLTLQTATAVARLADLQRRAERINEKRPPIARTALAELSTALEELQVANEALQTQVDEVTALRMSTENAFNAVEEVAQVSPIAAVWTDHSGVIEKANETASQLLNVDKAYLIGKPLTLFTADRASLFDAVQCLCDVNRPASVDVEITVQPRERPPCKMQLAGRRLKYDANRVVWFLHGSQLAADGHARALASVRMK